MGLSKWSESAKIVLDDCLSVTPKEKVLLIAGEGIEDFANLSGMLEALKAELFARGNNPCTISYYAEKGREVPELLIPACLDADVIIMIYARGLLHSSVFPVIQQNKHARMLLLPNGDNGGYMDRMLPKTREEFYEVADITGKVGKQFVDAPHTIHITAGNGTDLTLKIGELKGSVHTGILHNSGATLMPAGTLAIDVDEGSADGKLVIDCYTAVRPELLTDSITFDIQNGYAVSVSGGTEAEAFRTAAARHEGKPEDIFCIAEFGLGFCRNADININTGDGEHMYGAVHIGIGSNATFGGRVMIPGWHIDCILPKATVEVDGRLIAMDGVYYIEN